MEKMLLLLFVLVCFVPSAMADSCTDACVEKYHACIDRCGPNSNGSSCVKRCERRKDACLDICYGNEDKKTRKKSCFTGSNSIKEEEKLCESFYLGVKEILLKGVEAEQDGFYCEAKYQYQKAVDMLEEPTEECEKSDGWMVLIRTQQQKYTERVMAMNPLCENKKEERGASPKKSKEPLKVQKSNGGIVISQ